MPCMHVYVLLEGGVRGSWTLVPAASPRTNFEWFCTLTARFSDLSPSGKLGLARSFFSALQPTLSRFMERVKSNG